MPHKTRSLADEEKYLVVNLPPIERRSLMESAMRRRTTRFDVIVVVAFVVALITLLSFFLAPVISGLIRHIPDLFTSTGK